MLAILVALASPHSTSGDHAGAGPAGTALGMVRAEATGHGLGGITGQINDAATGEPVDFVRVDAWFGVESWGHATTGADGTYEILDLEPGTYFVTARSFNAPYVDELHAGTYCPTFSASGLCGGLHRGTPVVVVPETITVVDFALEIGGAIAGQIVAAPGGEPVRDSGVTVWDARGQQVALGSAPGGAYQIGKLPTGTYFVRTSGGITRNSRERLAGELYDDRLCPPPGRDFCDPRVGTPIGVTLGEVTPGIDFALGRLATISGRVLSAETAAPVTGALVRLYDAAGLPIALDVSSGPEGEFSFEVRRGIYYLWSEGLLHSLADEVYDALPCARESCDPTEGTPIVVGDGQSRTGVDLTLDVGGTLTGRVADLRERSLGAIVTLWSVRGLPAGEASTDAEGRYQFEHLPADSYFVVAQPEGSGHGELFSGQRCVRGGGPRPGCDLAAGTAVTVANDATTAGIDLAVREVGPVDCVASATQLCLQEGRFQVSVGWEIAPSELHPERRARTEPLTGETGYAWFFRPDNVEVLVKVLDACAPPFERFWVFAAGLTNLRVNLRVVDTWTGEAYHHQSRAGEPFTSLLDTDAFATCDAPAPAEPLRWVPTPTRRTPARYVPSGAAATSSCTPGPQRLCLGSGRFAVEALWETQTGQSGEGQAEPLTPDTGTFWFFNPLNLELIVKLLDACGPPYDRFWVFAAGLTDVDVLLRVTDTASGEIWEHHNPQGVGFQPVLDTSAFATCP